MGGGFEGGRWVIVPIKGGGWAINGEITHPSVVVGIDIDSGDSYGVQRVPDTQKTSKIPLPTDLPSKNPPTIPVPKKYPSSVRQNTGMWWIFFKNISHTTSHHTILMVLYAKIGFQASSIFP